MKTAKRIIPALIAAVLAGTAQAADEQQELLKLKNTTLNLIEALVKEGILSQERADTLIEQAELSAAEETRRQERMQAQAPQKVVRVPYVPEFVKDEIRQQVKAELREDVVGDVMKQAETERWGVPGTMPEWTSRIKVKGDIRLRAQADNYASDNLNNFIDFQETNESGSLALLNSTQDRERARVRLRLGVDAEISNNLKAGVRLVTGSETNPVSTNQTAGQTFQPYDIVLDRAFLKYDGYDLDRYPWLTLWGGRIPNPWLSTDLVWDSDVNFEGGAATFRYNLSGGNDLFDMDERNKTLFMTVGAFPLQEVSLTTSDSEDKWLFAGQLGGEWIADDQSTLKVGLAYYDYHNIEGRRNTLDSRLTDYTAPDYLQKGNSVFEISNDTGGSERRYGLASDFDLINLTVKYDIARFAPMHFMLDGDYVQNIGYDADDIRNRLNGSLFIANNGDAIDPGVKKNQGYHLKFTAGWPEVGYPRNWQAFIAYKYLERDAVLDAFTDSDFHLGGTNAKGWIIGGKYGLTHNAWLQARYLSAVEIDGPPLGIDVLQVDLNARF